tara:strand:- start:193 stop:387 length:195 start_codon:yes stop_codon:yes gene_type:complete
MYNKFFYDDIYEEDKYRAKNIIKKLEKKLKELDVKSENKTEEEIENILSKKLIVKILKYEFNIY